MNEPDVSSLRTVAEAIAIIDTAAVTRRVVRLPLRDAVGMRLAQSVAADRDFPPFDKSQMDGFAVRSADVERVPAELRVTGEVAAGAASDVTVGAGEAMAIMTGAPVPAGADGVVPVEDTQRRGDRVRIEVSARRGRNIAPRASDAAAGAMLLRQGTMIGPAQVAVAASVGASEVDVYARPRIVVMTTGNELVPMNRAPASAQIRESNGPMLAALLRRLGCDVSEYGIVGDDFDTVRSEMTAAWDGAAGSWPAHDVLVVSGGMSMGRYDYVPEALRSLGVELRVTKLRIRPGKPFVFGERGGRFVFGLPGNPVSAFVCALRLAARLLARMAGGEAADVERWVTGALAAPLPANGPREFYQPAVVDRATGRIAPLPWKGSGDIFALAAANVLVVRGENEPPREAGAVVRALEIP